MSADYLAPESFTEIKGRENLSLYQFGDYLVKHYFCKTCGIYTFHEAVEKPGYLRINLACVADLDLSKLSIGIIDGKSF